MTAERHDESREHLLEKGNLRSETQSKEWSCAWRWTWWFSQLIVFAANLIMLTTWTSPAMPASLRRPFELIDAPTRARTTLWNATLGQNSSFTSLDSAEADAAWAEIAVTPSQGYVKLSKSQLKQLSKYAPSSVRAADGSGYLGLIGVFHQLHCLDYLRKTNVLYSHLYPNTLEHPTVPVEYHIPHCINLIRMALQCYGELTTSTHNWVDGWIEPWEDWQTQHQCRDFDAIRDWARRNNAKTTMSYVHPELGQVMHSKINVSALPVGRNIRYVPVEDFEEEK